MGQASTGRSPSTLAEFVRHAVPVAPPNINPPGVVVVFCGINPAMPAAAAGHHFAGRGNRFWRVIHLAGFTPEEILPENDRTFLERDVKGETRRRRKQESPRYLRSANPTRLPAQSRRQWRPCLAAANYKHIEMRIFPRSTSGREGPFQPRHQRSRAMSPWGWLQQINRLPS